MTTNKQNQGTFLPDFCNTRTVFVIILLAELLAIVLTVIQHPFVYIHMVDLAMNSLFMQWVALSCTGTLCLFRGKLQHFSDNWVATISYVITLVVSLIVTEITWFILSRESGVEYFGNIHTLFLTRVMSVSAIVWALALRYFYVQHQWRLRIQSESEARFQALQSRIKPHFLFNCMNTIAGLIRRSPALAEESIEDLADLFRASLQDSQRTCSLEEEIALCKRYLRIERHRLGDRLKIVWDLDAMPAEVTLPVLSIQPLLENSVYHGIEPSPGGGTITVTGRTQNDRIIITIENPVLHPDVKENLRHGNQLAQNNVRQRLASFFEQKDLLNVVQDKDTYKATVIIPFKKS